MLATDHSGKVSLTRVPSSLTRRLVRTGAALRSTVGATGSNTLGSGLGTGRPSALATRSRLSAAIGVARATFAGPDLPVGNGRSAVSTKAFTVRMTSHATAKMKSRWISQK